MSSHKLPVVLSPRANADYASIVLHGVQGWGVDRAREYQAELVATVERLGDFPHLGRARDDLRTGCRGLRFKQHAIFYRIDDDAIVVLRILHVKMDAAAHLNELPGHFPVQQEARSPEEDP